MTTANAATKQRKANDENNTENHPVATKAARTAHTGPARIVKRAPKVLSELSNVQVKSTFLNGLLFTSMYLY